jgi:tetratricopeptide (TPR) repeat protein
MRKLILATLGGLLFASSALEAQEGPAAMIVRVSGSVNVRLGDAAPAPAAAGNRLAVGDAVIPDGGQATIVFSTGRTQQVTEALTIAAATGDESNGFARTIGVMASAASADARSRPNRQGMIRPIPGEPVLASPRNGIKIMDTRPTFTWLAVDGASSYTIQIRRDGGDYIRLQASDTVFTIPASVPGLVPGERYLWTVAPSGAGRPTREQPFEVIDSEEYAQVQESFETLLEADLDPFGDGLLFAAAVYREADLYYEAAGALDFLEESGSTLSAEAYLLRGEILDALGRLEDAARAFEEADRLMR